MKKLTTILAALFLSLSIFAQTAEEPAGKGTASNPYQIATLNNLYWLSQADTAWDKYFKQTADINASATQTWDGGKGFTPIGMGTDYFEGTYNGNGHVIDSLFIKRDSKGNVGLFGKARFDTIKNLGLENINIEGHSEVGGLIGWNHIDGMISNCFVRGMVKGSNTVGGFCGQNSSHITNSYANVKVSRASGSTDTVIGGFVGWGYYQCNINYCYSLGEVTFEGTQDPVNNGFIAKGTNNAQQTTNFLDTTQSNQLYGIGSIEKNSQKMKEACTYLSMNWDVLGETHNGSNDIWTINNTKNNGYPALQWQGFKNSLPDFCISIKEIKEISSNSAVVSGEIYEYMDGSSIDEKGACWNQTGTPDINDNKTTEGSATGMFSSTISGLNKDKTYHVRLYYNDSQETYYSNQLSFNTSPFAGTGTQDNPYQIADLQDILHLSQLMKNDLYDDKYYEQTASIDATSTQYWDKSDANNDGKNYNDSNDSSSNGNNEGFPPIGDDENSFTGSYNGQHFTIDGLHISKQSDLAGLFGDLDSASVNNVRITNCNIKMNDYKNIGGLAGSMANNSIIQNCYVNGKVQGHTNVGGLIGLSRNSAIMTTHTDVNVTGTYTNIGGFSGGNYSGSIIENCYSRSDVTFTRDVESIVTYGVGAMIGSASSDTVKSCYSTGNVIYNKGTDPTENGFIGKDNGGIKENNFFDKEASNQSSASGATAKTTSEMKNQTTFTNAGWDFENETSNGNNDYWSVNASMNDGYPILAWQDDLSVGLPTNKREDEIHIYPNPTDGELMVKTASDQIFSVQVVDISGGTVLQKNYAGNECMINLSSQSAGIYFVKITIANKKPVTKKVIKF